MTFSERHKRHRFAAIAFRLWALTAFAAALYTAEDRHPLPVGFSLIFVTMLLAVAALHDLVAATLSKKYIVIDRAPSRHERMLADPTLR